VSAQDSSTDDRIVNAMSIDVEDYFQVSAFDGVVARREWATRESRVVANTTRLLQIFAEADVRATFFVLGWVGERFPALVREIAAAGHEVASHGYGHELIYSITPDAFRRDVRRAKDVLEQTAGAPVQGYRAPSFSVVEASLWALDVLIEEGYTYDTSIFPVHHDRYGIAGAPRHAHVMQRAAGTIVEIPPSTVRLAGVNLPVAGGGYFRLLPYGWTAWGMKQVNRVDRQPVVFYLHPWEVDPEQPRIAAGRVSRFRHYTGLRQTEARLRQMLRAFRFDSVASVFRQTPAGARLASPGARSGLTTAAGQA
jgi:polysaccharide deacetylase family protein (PEP-CTERM system associated)